MKKSILFTFALMLSVSMVMAQKIDAEAFNSKLEKSDAECAHEKKGLKASAWLNRGDLYFSTVTEPTKSLFEGVDRGIVEAACGKPKYGKEMVGSKEYSVNTYPYFKAFIVDGKVVAWKDQKVIRKDALKIALESYAKAIELDPSVESKVRSSLDKMINYYKQVGSLSITLNDVKMGADAYMNVCKLQSLPYYNSVEPMMLFYAGYMATLQGEKSAWYYVDAEKLLKRAVEAGYPAMEDSNTEMDEEDRGNIYYYLYHCSYAQREKNPAKIADAKKYLQQGIELYPKNERIFEGLLQIYTNEAGMGDPQELLSTIESTIKVNPQSVNAWFARGRIYYALENYEECIASFKKVVELEPASFDGNYYLGLFYMLKGDSMLDEMKSNTYTDQSKYDADVASLNAVYADAIPCFEAAHLAKPKDESTLDYLKQLCFRLRDQPGVMEKYTKYNELYKAL